MPAPQAGANQRVGVVDQQRRLDDHIHLAPAVLRVDQVHRAMPVGR
jgi:hypothetical protein